MDGSGTKGEHINRYCFKGNSSGGNVNKLWHFFCTEKKEEKKKQRGMHNIPKNMQILTQLV